VTQHTKEVSLDFFNVSQKLNLQSKTQQPQPQSINQQEQLKMVCKNDICVSQPTIMIDNNDNDDIDNDESFSQSLKTIGNRYKTLSFPKMAPLQPTFTPGPYDVICARGKDAKNHLGNKRFRSKVKDALLEYSKSEHDKMRKSMILSDIVESVRRNSPLGGFVKSRHVKNVQDDGQTTTTQWYEVGDHLAREKVGQSFRDLLHGQYKSSTKSKRKRVCDQLQDFHTDMEQLARESDLICQHSKKLQRNLEQQVGVLVADDDDGDGDGEGVNHNNKYNTTQVLLRPYDVQVLRLFNKTNRELLESLKQDSRAQQQLQRLSEQ
jgi:hypothetical protein